MGLSQLHIGGPMSTTTRPHGGILAVLVQELPVEEGCTSTKHILVLGFLPPLPINTCGSTARMGDGPGPSFPLVTAFAPIGMPVRARTPRVRLLILPGVHARTVALRPVSHRPRGRPRRRRHRPRAITRATTPPTAFATMADPAPNTAAAGSAPTAPTAALVQSSCHVVMFHAALVIMGPSHLHMGPRISGPMSNTTGPHGITLAMLVQESPLEDRCTSTKPILVLGFLPQLSIDTCGSTAR